MSRVIAAVLLVVLLAVPRSAAAWTFREHEEIGSLAYADACKTLAAELAASDDERVRERLAIACENVEVNALLYGKANGTAGDRIADPEEFLSSIGAFRATSRVNYLRLKMVNSGHFHPKTTRQWQSFHRAALERAIEAASLEGIERLAAFELAVYENAFADHFLQDAFCAGHMGFNRTASSAAASLVFHDTWNEKGRMVRNRRGESWRTYGDGRLKRPENHEGRRRVIEVTAQSVRGVLRAFATGQRFPEHELAIWRALPFSIEAPEMRSPAERLLAELVDWPSETGFEPLAAINQPARKGLSLEAWGFARGFSRDATPMVGLLAGAATPVPFLAPTIYAGGGVAVAPSGRVRPAVELGVVRPIGLTFDGVMSHDVTAGFNWLPGLERLRGAAHAGYRLSFELGQTLLRLQAGPTYMVDTRRFGAVVTLGAAHVVTARGGGSL